MRKGEEAGRGARIRRGLGLVRYEAKKSSGGRAVDRY